MKKAKYEIQKPEVGQYHFSGETLIQRSVSCQTWREVLETLDTPNTDWFYGAGFKLYQNGVFIGTDETFGYCETDNIKEISLRDFEEARKTEMGS